MKYFMGHWWNDADREKAKILEKNLSYAKFPPINGSYTYTAQVSNPDRFGETTMINQLRTILPGYIL
jgi:hypothetical protein